jgi:hypothetical protein
MQAADNIPAAFFIGDDGCYESDLKSCPGACRQFANAKRGRARMAFRFGFRDSTEELRSGIKLYGQHAV